MKQRERQDLKERIGDKNPAYIHGLSHTPLYSVWREMKYRCVNPNNKKYQYYGGRGIKVCDRWMLSNGQGFINFMNDMGPRPKNYISLEEKKEAQRKYAREYYHRKLKRQKTT